MFGRGAARSLQCLAARIANVMLRFLQTIWKIITRLRAEIARSAPRPDDMQSSFQRQWRILLLIVVEFP